MIYCIPLFLWIMACLQVSFVALKLLPFRDMSWWVVLLPLWGMVIRILIAIFQVIWEILFKPDKWDVLP